MISNRGRNPNAVGEVVLCHAFDNFLPLFSIIVKELYKKPLTKNMFVSIPTINISCESAIKKKSVFFKSYLGGI